MIDPTAAEELKRLAWRPVRLQARRNAQEFHLGTKGPIHLVRAEGAGVQRPRHELPERIELGEARARRAVIVRGGVVDVRGDPHDVADSSIADEPQHTCNLQLAAERRTVVFVCHRLEGTAGVRHDDAERQVRGDDFPGGGRRRQRALEPGGLRRAEDRRLLRQRCLSIRGVGAAVRAHVEREDFEHGTVAPRPVDALALDRVDAQGQVLEERPLRARRQQGHAFHVVARVALEALGRIPVVPDLVIVPQRDLRHVGVEAPHVLVLQIVAVASPIVVERLRHSRLRLGDHVAPDRPLVQHHFRLERLVRVDRVAEVDEHVGLRAPHRVVQPDAAARGIDAPALPDAVP